MACSSCLRSAPRLGEVAVPENSYATYLLYGGVIIGGYLLWKHTKQPKAFLRGLGSCKGMCGKHMRKHSRKSKR
jgi:hypothetical protein